MQRGATVISGWLLSLASLLACDSRSDGNESAAVGAAGASAGVGGVVAGGGAPGSIAAGGAGGGAAPPGGAAGNPQSGGGGSGTGAVSGAAGNAATAGTEGGGSGAGGEASSAPDAWTMIGGDVRSRYFNPAENVLSVANAATLVEKWRFTVSGFPPGSPVIAEGKVFVMATGGSYAIDLESGTQIWARTDLPGTASVAYDAGFVYVHTRGPDLYKVSAADGTTVWGPKKTYDLASCDGTSSPIVGGGKVVVGFSCGAREITSSAAGSRGGLTAHDAETGDKLWQHFTVPESGEDGAMVWSSVAIDVAAGTVFATTGNNYTLGGANSDSIRAIDLTTGTMPPRWSTQVRQNDVWSYIAGGSGEDSDFGANPILAEVDGRQVVAAGDKGAAFWMLDRETGDILWSREDLSPSHNAANGGVLMNGAFDGRYFYVVSNDPTANQSVLHKLDPAMNGASVWTKTYEEVTWGAPSLANGVLYVPINDELLVLDAETGDTLTSFNAGGTIAAGAAAIAQGRVVVQSGLSFVFADNAINNNEIICYGLP